MMENPKQIAVFKCNLHQNILNQEFLQANADLFPAAYYGAEAMAKLYIKLSEVQNSPLVMLPLDYSAEAQGYGLKLSGYEDCFGLRPNGKLIKTVDELAYLPKLDFSRGRLSEILKAIAIVKQLGLEPALGVCGFFSLVENLLPMEKLFAGWQKQQSLLLDFFDGYGQSLKEYISLAIGAGARVILYSDSITDLELLGKRNGKRVADQVLVPFCKELSTIEQGVLVHICGVSSNILPLADSVQIQLIAANTQTTYTQNIVDIAKKLTEPQFLGFACLHHQRISQHLTKISFV